MLELEGELVEVLIIEIAVRELEVTQLAK